MNKHLSPLVVVMFILPLYAHAQLYLGILGDIGNRPTIASDDRIQNAISGSFALNIFVDTQIKNNFYIKYGLSSGFINAKAVIPAFGSFEEVYVANLFHTSGNLAFGKRFNVGEQGFIDFFAGGGASFYGGDDYGGKYGPTSTNDIVFEFESSRVDNKPKGFAELLIQTKLNRLMLFGLRYQQHFSQVIEGTYILYDGNQPAMRGSLSLIPACVSLQVAFKIVTLARE